MLGENVGFKKLHLAEGSEIEVRGARLMGLSVLDTLCFVLFG